ncbi:MAG: OmpA family protein [Flavobacteriales bacterium]
MESATGLSIIRRVMAFTMAAAIGLLSDGPRAQQVVPLDALNSPNDEVLLGWDGSDLFYRSIPRTSDTVKAGDWFLSPGQEYVATPAEGWASFDQGLPMNLRAWSAADWPGIGEVQHVTIDAERGVLVLSALQPTGDFDLFMAQRSGSAWSDPQPLAGLNTAADEVFPNFDNGALLFASNGHPGQGGFDVYRSERRSHYAKCKGLGHGVNTAGDELAAVAAGAHVDHGYYVSAVRMGGRGVDLYWVGDMADEGADRKKELAVEVVYRRAPVESALFEIRDRAGALVVRRSTDGQGRLVLGALALDAALEVQVSMKSGRAIPDGAICHVYERCGRADCGEAHWPGWRRVRSYRIEGGAAFVFDLLPLDALERWPRPSEEDAARWQSDVPMCRVKFATAEYTLRSSAEQQLTQWLDGLNWTTQSGHFEVRGYTDAQGEVVRNQVLSEQRAEQTARMLQRAGVQPSQIQWSGHGVASEGDNEADRRRVEVRWVVAPD